MRLSHLPAICGDYRFFREKESFRNGIVKIAATKISAGVSTGIGDHEGKYKGKEIDDAGDEQFEIADDRSFAQMYRDIEEEGCSLSSMTISMYRKICVTNRHLAQG